MVQSKQLSQIGALGSASVVAVVTFLFSVASPNSAAAQYPVIITPPQPALQAVVGYTPEPRGLWGQRVMMRPVVAPVTTVLQPAALPTATTQVFGTTVARPVIVARPNLAFPMVAPANISASNISAPAITRGPVVPSTYSSYYAPLAPVAAVATPAITVVPTTPPTNVYIPPSWTY
ncbi:MAG: hypothetical protein NXI32_11800 [bacterium]|nr:hypothetical protein [bacterium]